VLDRLDAAAVRRWCAVGLDALRRHRAEIDELNVYPVPDGDTGTNMVLTFGAAWEAIADPTSDGGAGHSGAADGGPGAVLQRIARAALMGARGNSGVILSQLLRAMAEAVGPAPEIRGRLLADALTVAAQAAWRAVAEPVEGTVLSVATAAAQAAGAADTDDLATVAEAAAQGATEALARTPEQLPVLARAGVVDAGGRGLVVLLDALVEVVTGRAPATEPPVRVVRDAATLTVPRETGSPEYAYEVQYLLDAPEEAVADLRSQLLALGDSVVIVGSGIASADPALGPPGGVPVWNVHVHVNDVGAAIEAGVRAGRPHRISVTRFADEAAPVGPATREPGARGLVVVTSGPGLAKIFEEEGAVVVNGGPTTSPSTRDLLQAIQATGAGLVAVLPNDPDVLAVAQAAAEQARATGIDVGVVPTRSPVQAMAAIAVRDHTRHFHDDMIAMAEAAGACRYAEVTVATRPALTVAGRCEPGDVLGLVEGDVNVIGRDLPETCMTLLDRMLGGGGELVTLVLGADAPDGLGEALTTHLAHAWPFVEVRTYDGGQPHHPLLVGVE
jgi:DAK2 domain fusion protein YloV